MKVLIGSCRITRVVSIKVQKQILFNKTVIELVCNALASFEVLSSKSVMQPLRWYSKLASWFFE
jgi:hypothetical protein